MKNDISEKFFKDLGLVVKKNELLAHHTTFKIGGPAKYFVAVDKIDDLVKTIKTARNLRMKYCILGGGSNLLVSDRGFDGLVIKNKTNNIKIAGIRGRIESQKQTSEVFIEADSGTMFNRLVRFALDGGWGGLENFLGQPGTVGGAVYINAHSNKGKDWVSNYVVRAKILTTDNKVKTVLKTYFHFAYDQSILQQNEEIVLRVVFRFKKGNKQKLWQQANQAMDYRRQTQPQGLASSGCIFRNIDLADALRIGTANHTQSAGFLIEAVGLKGKKIGTAMISKTHANFFVNTGNAKASDIYQLIKLAKKEVKKKFGVELKEEIVLLGKYVQIHYPGRSVIKG